MRVPLVRKHHGISQGPLNLEVVVTVWEVKATRQTPTLPTHILPLRKIVACLPVTSLMMEQVILFLLLTHNTRALFMCTH